METHNIILRRMTADDIPLGMRLKEAAGWNQTEADWAMLLEASRGLAFVAQADGADVGTALAIPYGRRFSWIGMVLVNAAHRRRGIGTTLLNAAIEAARGYGTVRLDATPMGQPLYAGLGFVVERQLLRMLRMTRSARAQAISPGVEVRPLDAQTFPRILRFDEAVFGADRSAILTALWRRAPQTAWFSEEGGELTGFVLGREGSEARQIGPLVARSSAAAQALLAAALSACPEDEIILDALTGNPDWLAHLEQTGFQARRPFIRMYLGELCYPGQPEHQYAIAGPELG